jgi:C4-dicarboxylate-binding protein DctP
MKQPKPQAIIIILICLTALSVAFTVSSCSKSPDDKTYRMRASTSLAAHGTVGKALEKFCQLVEEKSNGRIKTQDYYVGQLGNQRELVEMVHDGSLEVVTSLASGTARYVPQLALFEYPYIYKDEAHLVRVLDELEDYVSALLAPHNFIAAGGQNMGFRHMLNKTHPVKTVADLKGLKMRGPNPIYVGMFKALGARGTTTDWSEIYSALQTGVINGLEASPDMLLSMKFHEQAEYLSKTSHIAACVYYMIRKDWLESLPEDLQKIVIDCAREAAAYQNDLDKTVQKEAMQTMIADGVNVNEVDDIDEFKNRLADFKEQYVAGKGAAWRELYDKIKAVE